MIDSNITFNKYLNPKPIAILMGTYNGEQFLDDQIQSLLSQTNQDWTLYIRDDGSSDSTLDIIQEYANKYEQIIHIEDKLGNLWCMHNFYQLMSYVDSQYFMFCDQDDVWLDTKIEDTYGYMLELEKTNPNIPIVVYTDLVVVDESLNKIQDSFWHQMKIVPSKLKKFENLAVYNAAWGCTMLFNSFVKKIVIPLGKNANMHDSYICMKVAYGNGIVSALDKPTILYRQHGKNAFGAQDYHTNYLKNKLVNITQIISDNIVKYKMANDIRPFSVFEYLYYKFKYTFSR